MNNIKHLDACLSAAHTNEKHADNPLILGAHRRPLRCMQTGHFTPAAPRRHAVSQRILEGLIGLFLVAMAGCGGGPGDNVEVEQHEGLTVRYFDGAERHATAAEIHAIWLDTEACVTGSAGLAVPPVVDFLPVEYLTLNGREVNGYALPWENRIVLPHSSLRPHSDIQEWKDYTTLRHEFIHLLGDDIGMSTADNYGHNWPIEIRACAFFNSHNIHDA